MMQKVILNGFGQTLGIDKDNFAIRRAHTTLEKVPFWKTNEIVIAGKNTVSVDALLWASFYNVDVIFTLHNGKPLAFLHSIKDKGNVKTRLNQLRAYESRKGLEIAKSILIQKIQNENNLLKHHKLKTYEQNSKLPNVDKIENIDAKKISQNIRLKLNSIEERFSSNFYSQVFRLFPKWLRVKKRAKRNAIEPLNNLLNLSYEILQWKIMKAVLKAKLEPYLGFLHSVQYSKPSLVCDLMEPFRPYIIHFLINYSKTIERRDFKRAYVKNKYPRYFLKHEATWKLIENINKQLFEAYIPMQRNRKHGFRMQFETFIDEYVSKIAKHINISNTRAPQPEYPPYTLSTK